MKGCQSVRKDTGFGQAGKLVPEGLLPAREEHSSERTATLWDGDNLDSVLSLTQSCRSIPLFCRHDNFFKNYIKHLSACIFIKHLLWDDVMGTMVVMGVAKMKDMTLAAKRPLVCWGIKQMYRL